MHHYIKIALLMFCFLYSNAILADQPADIYESTDNLKAMAKDFIAKNVALEPEESMDVQINQSDLPTELTKCSTKIEISFPREVIREKINSIELVCNGDKSWRTYLPVNVQIYTKVVTAKYPISTDAPISETDLDYAQANINRLYNGYFKDKKEVIGYVASQTINPGMVISRKNVRRPQLVRKNQEIELIAKKNSIAVTMQGIAKSDGSLNDTIQAYNPSSKKTIEAVVVGLNKAEVL